MRKINNKVQKKCKVCGAEFMASQYGNAKYCIPCRQKKQKGLKQDDIAFKKRRCHDCGKITYNYRCDSCWEKLRRKLGLVISA